MIIVIYFFKRFFSYNYHNIFNWGGQLDNYKPIQESFEPNLPCVVLWSLIVFFTNGDVPLCNVDYNNKYPNGNVMKNSIREIWQSKIINERRDWHLKNKKNKITLCQGCNVWDERSGEGFESTGKTEKLISPQYAEKVSISSVGK